MKHLVFVYGTLKKGHGNNVLLRKSKFIRRAKFRGIDLYDGHAFPFAKIGKGSTIGEIYEVDDRTLARLDKLEGHPTFYKRVSFNTQKEKVWIYIYQGDVNPEDKIISGIWG